LASRWLPFFSSSGQPGFAVWVLAIFIAGSIGYVKELKPIATAFIVLIIVVMLLSNKGFFARFTAAINGIGNSDKASKNFVSAGSILDAFKNGL
jgi:hypothetical protein